MKKKLGVPTLLHEIQAGYPGAAIIGIDEVGRGCLAGPVVAGAVMLKPYRLTPEGLALDAPEWISQVRDSKLLSPEVRERLAPLIEAEVLAFALGSASVEEIDRINIYHASHLAMVRAAEALMRTVAQAPRSAFHALVDGNRIPKTLKLPATAIVKGDQKSISIACASILAKVSRDRTLVELDARFPGYGFANHKGYFTPEHQAALKRLGACEAHRRSFGPVAACRDSSLLMSLL